MGVEHKRVGRSEHAEPQQDTWTGLGQRGQHLGNQNSTIEQGYARYEEKHP